MVLYGAPPKLLRHYRLSFIVENNQKCGNSFWWQGDNKTCIMSETSGVLRRGEGPDHLTIFD